MRRFLTATVLAGLLAASPAIVAAQGQPDPRVQQLDVKTNDGMILITGAVQHLKDEEPADFMRVNVLLSVVCDNGYELALGATATVTLTGQNRQQFGMVFPVCIGNVVSAEVVSFSVTV